MTDDLISRQQAIEVLRNRWLKTRNYDGIGEDIAEECEIYLKTLPSAQPEPEAVFEWKREFKEYIESLDITRDEWKGIIEYINDVPTVQPERKDAVEKAVAVEAISDELMSRFDISTTYAYEIAEKAMNRIEAMAKELERGEQDDTD